MFAARPLAVNVLLLSISATTPPRAVEPMVYVVPFTGVGATPEVLVTTRYLFAVGLASVKEPGIVVVVVVVNDKAVGWAVGVKQEAALIIFTL